MKSFSVRPMWAGFALFFSMYYVLESNPTILRDIGIPASAALLGTFLAVILGNLSGAFLTNTGLMIAPAIGISVFVKNFVLNAGTIDWRHAMLACAIGGILVFLTSLFTDWRARIVNELPDPVKKGATAGIGALLVKEGFDIFEAATTKFHFEPRWGGIFVGLGVIILAGFAAARARFESLSNDERQSGKVSFFRFAMHLEFVLVVVVMSFYLWTSQPSYINELQESAKLTFLWADPEVWQGNWNFDDTGVKGNDPVFCRHGLVHRDFRYSRDPQRRTSRQLECIRRGNRDER